jgi:hypothetical protein
MDFATDSISRRCQKTIEITGYLVFLDFSGAGSIAHPCPKNLHCLQTTAQGPKSAASACAIEIGIARGLFGRSKATAISPCSVTNTSDLLVNSTISGRLGV